MAKIANNLINQVVNTINNQDINPYLLYYFFPDNGGEFKVDKPNSLKRFDVVFSAFDLLREIGKKRDYILRQLESECYYIYKVEAVLTQNAIPGIGIESSYETGIRLHYIYGFPFIPGSEIKGNVLSYVNNYLNMSQTDPDVVSIFGSQNKKGSVLFFDAYPELPNDKKLFNLDIVTPHYQPYYGKGEIPGDWFSPVPIHFLTIKKGTIFTFVLATKELNKLNKVSEWLKDTLTKAGVGAKTMTGFGHFKFKD